MAPTSAYKKRLDAVREESSKAEDILNGRHRSATKSKKRKHGLSKMIGRGLHAAMKVCSVAKAGSKHTEGLRNIVSHGLAGTVLGMLGKTGRKLTGRDYHAGINVEMKRGEGGTDWNVSLNFKTTKGGDRLQFNSQLRCVNGQYCFLLCKLFSFIYQFYHPPNHSTASIFSCVLLKLLF